MLDLVEAFVRPSPVYLGKAEGASTACGRDGAWYCYFTRLGSFDSAQPQAQRGERELLTSNAVPRASLEEKIPTLTILPILS